MSTIQVQIVQAGAPIPGNTRAGTQVTVTDSTGAQSPVMLTGQESPPWSLSATVNGNGQVSAQDVDSSGAAIGSPVTQSYTLGGGTGTQQLATSGINVTTTSP